MAEVSGDGRKRPNGARIVTLRKEKGMKQEVLADKAKISVRHLREIELRNRPVQPTHITDIAAALGVNAGEITVSTPDTSPTRAGSLLKLRVVRSATELGDMADYAARYEWKLKIDPSTATAADMQAVMMIVKRLVRPVLVDDKLRDDFDNEEFGEIPRLARLQELLGRLHTNGVNVIAGTYTFSWARSPVRDDALIVDDVPWVRVPGETDPYIFDQELILLIHFVPCDVEEEVVQIKPGRSLEEFERVDGWSWEELLIKRPFDRNRSPGGTDGAP
jgi:transcriptional regulator with XRE-family HTH domain